MWPGALLVPLDYVFFCFLSGEEKGVEIASEKTVQYVK
jgi:hypothetical protein